MKFTCGALECPSFDANDGDPHKTLASSQEESPAKAVIERAPSEPKPLAWLGRPADDEDDEDDEDEEDDNKDEKEPHLVPVDENAKMENGPVNALASVSPSSVPLVAPSKSFHSETAATVDSATVESVNLEKKREDLASAGGTGAGSFCINRCNV